MRKAQSAGAVVAAAAAMAVVTGAGPASGAIAPDADVAYGGHVSLSAGRIAVWLRSVNHGPSSLANATVRLQFSEPLADGRELSQGCLRSGQHEVLCQTGALPVMGEGQPVALDLWTRGQPAEVTVRIDTAWNGGATDRNPLNNELEVLVPATGDPYFI
ncbi:hypothetical protein GCM10020367_36320 [Streptomyces sannanensis]|uniref:DUF11 domain-containing protein n=2 Tax=Streptomyces sannanensis TaxID=285536 RepID=A0ABP6SEN4_9ACTN